MQSYAVYFYWLHTATRKQLQSAPKPWIRRNSGPTHRDRFTVELTFAIWITTTRVTGNLDRRTTGDRISTRRSNMYRQTDALVMVRLGTPGRTCVFADLSTRKWLPSHTDVHILATSRQYRSGSIVFGRVAIGGNNCLQITPHAVDRSLNLPV